MHVQVAAGAEDHAGAQIRRKLRVSSHKRSKEALERFEAIYTALRRLEVKWLTPRASMSFHYLREAHHRPSTNLTEY